jgi:hypothetical protein
LQVQQRVLSPKANRAAPARTPAPTRAAADHAQGLPGYVQGSPGHNFGRIQVHADRSEREADAIAENLLAPRPSPIDAAGPVAGPGPLSGLPVAADRVAHVRAALSGGESLPRDLRDRFEPALGTDLGAVRLHHGPQASLAAEALRAKAFAAGPHVVFGAGRYAPGTQAGLRLLAHELAHVVQQGVAGTARVDRANAADPRLPATQAEALADAAAAAADITAALASLGHAPDLRSKNVPALVAQEGLTLRPLTPRHDATVATPPAPNPPINFFTGQVDYTDSVLLPGSATHTIDAARTKISIRARNHVNVDLALPAADIEQRIVAAVSEVAHTRAARKTAGGLTVFDRYRASFNALYQQAPFTGMSDQSDVTLSSRGPKTERSRKVFEAVHDQDPAFAAAYDANSGGMKEKVDTYTGPEGLNLLNSPGLQRLRAVFFPLATPVPAAGYAAFKAAITAVAMTLTAEDRAEVDRSGDWQLLLDAHLTTAAHRDEIKDIIRTATPPAAAAAAPAAAPPLAAPPPGGPVNPQTFVNSVRLDGPAAPVPAIGRTLPVTLTPKSGQANPAVAVSSQVTVTPAASVVGPNVSPATAWPNAAVTGAPFTPVIAVTGPIGLDAELALVNGPAGLAPAAPIPKLHFVLDDQRRANIAAGWQPAIEFNDGATQALFVAASVPRYFGGSQTLDVKATMPVAPNANPGLTMSIEVVVRRGGAAITGPVRGVYPPLAAESNPVNRVFAAPAVIPAGGDPVEVHTSLLDSTGAVISARVTAMTILPAAAYPQADAQTAWTDDEAHLHSAAPGGFIAFLAAGAGAAPGLSGQIDRPGHPGKVIIHPMVERHDSAAYVAAEHGGVPNPSQAAYVVKTPPYHPHPDPAHTLVLGRGAGGWRLSGMAIYPGTFILLSRTPDVTMGVPRRPDDDLQTLAVHESTHFLDPDAITPIQSYKTEFRAYWMDGRFGPPDLPTAPNPGDFAAEFDPTIPPPGPKSPRANKIFHETYDDPVLYPYCKPNYDANTNHFREQVDSYLVPDGINLILSRQLDRLRSRFNAGLGASFATFRTQVLAFFGAGPPPAGGALSPDEKDFISRSRAWRDTVDNLAGATSGQKATLKNDMGIP